MNEDSLSSAYDQLHQSLLQIEDLTRVEERKRIARDLHDSLGYALTALNVQLQTAAKLWKVEPAKAELFLNQAQLLGTDAIAQVRQSVRLLRSLELPERSLETMIESLVENVQQATRLSITTALQPTTSIPPSVAAMLYRVVQEALTNICKYAAATTVQIQLESLPEHLQLQVIDDGHGFNLDEHQTGFGLIGMAERVEAMHGKLQIDTAPGKGCRICVTVPLDQAVIEADAVSSEIAIAPEPTPKLPAVPEPLKPVQQSPRLTIAPEQLKQLEETLANYIGPIAPVVLQKVMSRSQHRQALIDQLDNWIDAVHKSEFQQSATLILQSAESTPKKMPHHCIDEAWLHRCQLELSQAVGPIAPLLIDQILQANPEISQVQLIEILSSRIDCAEAALVFQRQMMI